MKKICFLPMLFLSLFAFSQKQFVLQNGTALSFDNLTTAIESASAGDTIYIPGGGFTAPATIDKTLHWRGVGHYPDSTVATGHTQITSPLVFTGNCDRSTFEGIYFQTTVTFGSNDDECTDIIMKRCRLGGNIYLRSTTDVSSGNPDLAFHLTECVTNSLDARYGKNVRIEKNLIFGVFNNFYLSIFSHNTINTRHYSNRVIVNSQNCQFINNIFAYNYGFYGTSANCNFENNIFQSGLPYNPATSTHTGSGNIYSTGTDIYTTIAGDVYTFNYANNYHLRNDVTGTSEDGTTVSIKNTATNGTDPGIYGTTLPYKEGAVPYAPHIRIANIDNEAANGELGVKITVAAQER